MPDTINIKNKGSVIYIGKTLCRGGGSITAVDKKDLENFCKTPGGAARYNTTLFVRDKDFESQKKAERNALKTQAEAEAIQKLEPIIRKEISEEVEKKYKRIIEGFQKKIEELTAAASPEETGGDENDDAAGEKSDSEKSDETDEFAFDPETHHIEHRGGGSWFVMNQETKIKGPLTEDERAEFEATLNPEE